jgi:hypothetical protein
VFKLPVVPKYVKGGGREGGKGGRERREGGKRSDTGSRVIRVSG